MKNPPDSCLRPDFTGKVAQLLDKSRTVNVFGEEGHGLGRLVDDLAHCCPDEARFIRLNMKSFADSYEGFLQALGDALDVRESENRDLRTTINRFLTDTESRIWLCIENFDRLASKLTGDKSVDVEGYNIHFLNYINGLNNNPRVSLLLTSRREIATQELYIGGKRVRGSRLDIGQRLSLEDLTFTEIENHLQGALPVAASKKARPLKQLPFFAILVTEIAAHPEPFYFLEFIAHKIPTDPATPSDELQSLMRHWKKDYAGKHSRSTDLLISDLEHDAGRWLDRASRLLGISKVIRSINTRIALILGIIGSVFWGIYQYGERLWHWLAPLFSK
jgi:hypothetical protein